MRRSLCVLVPVTLPWCSIHEHRVSSLFSALINTTNAPPVVVKELSRILVRLASSPSDADHGAAEAEMREKTIRAARSLLSLVHQRHPELLRGIADGVLPEAGEPNEDRTEPKKMENELLASFSLGPECFRGCSDIWDQASLGREVLEVDKDDSDGGSEKVCEANLRVADKIAGEWFSTQAMLGR